MGVTAPGRKCLPLDHEAAELPEHRPGLGGVSKLETANDERTVLGNCGAQPVAVLRCPVRGVSRGMDLQHRRCSGPKLRTKH